MGLGKERSSAGCVRAKIVIPKCAKGEVQELPLGDLSHKKVRGPRQRRPVFFPPDRKVQGITWKQMLGKECENHRGT